MTDIRPALAIPPELQDSLSRFLVDHLQHAARARGLIYLGIAFDCLFIAIWGYTGYASLISGGPSFVLGLVVVLISLGLIILYGLVRALKTAPAYVRNIEKKLGVT